jgi:short-subunit dehydrogenase
MIKNNHGLWVTVASLAGYVTPPGLTDYSASKASAIAFHEGLSAELATIYKAPAVRTVLLCQGYTRTALFQGFHDRDRFLSYPLDPGTVADAIVEAVLKGQSDHIVLPVANSILAGVRNWPLWMQVLMRNDFKKLMVNWNGRQVPQPSENGGGSQAATPVDNRSIETSGVLV